METIYIKKYKNGYTVEIGFLSDEEEMYLYKTREELLAELPTLIVRAEEIASKESDKKE